MGSAAVRPVSGGSSHVTNCKIFRPTVGIADPEMLHTFCKHLLGHLCISFLHERLCFWSYPAASENVAAEKQLWDI
jgi:hypothetical protein